MTKASELLPAVSDILFREWDPIGINDNEGCRDEYNGYVPAVVQWLLSGADEYMLASRLSQIQRVGMGMTVIDEELHRRVAHRLLGLVTDAVPSAPHGSFAGGGGIEWPRR
jgi:hypothetical protein